MTDSSRSAAPRLTALGMRGIRYHMLAGGGVTWDSMAQMAARVAPHGWHVQVQAEGGDWAQLYGFADL